MRMNTYMNFRGKCAEAFRYYERHLGANYLTLRMDSNIEAEGVFAALSDGGRVLKTE